jgi:hypothetical protein
MRGIVNDAVKRFLVLWFPFFMIAQVFGQEGEPGSSEIAPLPDSLSIPPAAAAAAVTVNPVQSAVLEGIQISSEPSKEGNENVVTGYFIFRDKPSSYFYEVKRKTNKLVFEFNDTRKGESPVESQKQPPIEGFELEQRKTDVNKDVKGLNPEWHDMVSVTFNLSAIPKINVTDEYNVISFSYKWSTDPQKQKALVDRKGSTNWGLMGGLAGGGALALGAVLYFLLKPPPPPVPDGALDTNDLPLHTQRIR